MRLLPRVNLQRPLWRDGPELGKVLEAQLTPRRHDALAPRRADRETATRLLLLLRR